MTFLRRAARHHMFDGRRLAVRRWGVVLDHPPGAVGAHSRSTSGGSRGGKTRS